MKRPMPTSDLVVRQWDIVVVPFPYANQLAEKRRPALVVSGNGFNRQSGLLWVAMITSTRAPWPGDVPIDDHRTCGLPVPSTIRPAKIATIEASRVLRVAGRIAAPEAGLVEAYLTSTLRGD